MRPPQHASLSPASTPELLQRVIGAVIGVVVVVGLTATIDSLGPTAGAAAGSVIPATSTSPDLLAERAVVRFPKAVTAPARRPAPRPAAKHVAKRAARQPAVVRKSAVRRWLPAGTGMWLHEWSKSNGGNARAIVARARRAGVSTLYVRGWSKQNGWEAPAVLHRLLPATRNTNVKVVVWEFAYLKNPVAEARRLAAAARIRVPGAPRVVAVAPDIETAAEGTAINSRRVLVYMSVLRRSLPRDVSILVTVPWPSEHRVGRYPYAAAARYANAVMPMAYWYNRSPVAVTLTSIRFFKRFHRPVLPVGQGYDGRLDAPWLPPANVGKQVVSFLLTAKRQHVRAISLWSWQTASQGVWGRLSGARADFAVPAPALP